MDLDQLNYQFVEQGPNPYLLAYTKEIVSGLHLVVLLHDIGRGAGEINQGSCQRNSQGAAAPGDRDGAAEKPRGSS
jgi:hypothetical protein